MKSASRLLILSLVLLLALTAVAGCGGAEAGSDERPETLRVAVTDLIGMEELQRNFGPFQEEMAEIMDMEVELLPVSDRVAAVTALESDRVDLVLTGPSEYVVMRERSGAAPVVGITRPGYYSVIATLADSPFESVEDLEGGTIAMSDVGSTSGHLGPSVVLQDEGLNPLEDVEIEMLGDGDLLAFSNGETDAWGGNALDLEVFIEEQELPASDFRVIAEGEPLPNDLFIANPNLSEDFIAEIQAGMEENEDAILEAILQGEENEKYVGAELIEAQDPDYDYMREAYRAIGVEDFSEFVGE